MFPPAARRTCHQPSARKATTSTTTAAWATIHPGVDNLRTVASVSPRPDRAREWAGIGSCVGDGPPYDLVMADVFDQYGMADAWDEMFIRPGEPRPAYGSLFATLQPPAGEPTDEVPPSRARTKAVTAMS